MKRRTFLKTPLAFYGALAAPRFLRALDTDLSKVGFDSGVYQQNGAQIIMIFLYGGASELAGNLTNIEEIKKASQSDYDGYFRGITKTSNGFWQEAGGVFMETLLAGGDLSVFRTCYSKHREDTNNKSHGKCVSQNQKGRFDTDKEGIFTTLAQILKHNGVIDKDTVLPFITMEGESQFFAKGDREIEGFLKPVGIGKKLDNPYARSGINRWYYYNAQEREIKDYQKIAPPLLSQKMDDLAQSQNGFGAIKEAFSKRGSLEKFIERIKTKSLPAGIKYPDNNQFAQKLQTAVKILVANRDTKIISLGNDGLGGWDDHNEARDYVTRMENLFSALSIAMAHIKAEGKEKNISIMVFGEFGRNVNLNSALGWDHGNNQNLYVLGGKGYFKTQGIVGETTLYNPNRLNRLYLKPKEGSYSFEPLCIAATVYKAFGVTNPAILTGGYDAVRGL